MGKYLQNSHYGLGYLKSINNNGKETKMKILFNSRQFHKALAPWVFLSLFISSITGLFIGFQKIYWVTLDNKLIG